MNSKTLLAALLVVYASVTSSAPQPSAALELPIIVMDDGYQPAKINNRVFFWAVEGSEFTFYGLDCGKLMIKERKMKDYKVLEDGFRDLPWRASNDKEKALTRHMCATTPSAYRSSGLSV